MLPNSLLSILALLVPLGLIGVIIYLLRLQKSQHDKIVALEEEKKIQQQNTTREVQQILQDAQKEAIKIITAANSNAKEILTKAQEEKGNQNTATQQNIELLAQKQEEALKIATDNLAKSFQDSIQKLQSEDINIVKKLTKDIENSVAANLGSFQQILEQETVSSQKIVGEKIEDEYIKVQQEVELYKKEELKKVDQKIQELVKKVAEEVLKKTLTLDDQFDLLQHSLTDAKEQLQLTPPTPEENQKPTELSAHDKISPPTEVKSQNSNVKSAT